MLAAPILDLSESIRQPVAGSGEGEFCLSGGFRVPGTPVAAANLTGGGQRPQEGDRLGHSGGLELGECGGTVMVVERDDDLDHAGPGDQIEEAPMKAFAVAHVVVRPSRDHWGWRECIDGPPPGGTVRNVTVRPRRSPPGVFSCLLRDKCVETSA